VNTAAIRFETTLLVSALLSPRCLLTKLAFAAGVFYLVGPINFIPNTVPYFGHADEVSICLTCLALARFFVPVDLDRAVASRCRFAGYRTATAQPSRLARLRYRMQSHASTHSLLWRRSLHRLQTRPSTWSRLRTHIAHAAQAASPQNTLFRLLGYRLWWTLRAPFGGGRSASTTIVVIGGASRSGTTLLRTVLGRHPLIASLPETTVFLQRISSPATIADRIGWDAGTIETMQRDSRSQRHFIERFHQEIQRRTGKPVWAEKTPRNVTRFGFVRRHFPNVKIIHVVRDGRDVVCSLRQKSFAKLDGAAADSTAAAQRCAVQWRQSVRAGLRHRGHPNYLEIRYEDLVHTPEPTLRTLLNFLDIPWDDQILHARPEAILDPYETRATQPITPTSVARWHTDLPPQDLTAIHPLITPTLTELGYETSTHIHPAN
jgi:uncharacterized membrane protein YkvA (DUF1232 family)